MRLRIVRRPLTRVSCSRCSPDHRLAQLFPLDLRRVGHLKLGVRFGEAFWRTHRGPSAEAAREPLPGRAAARRRRTVPGGGRRVPPHV
jgi:hypothetical protein